jgi:hypothetical protein
VRLERKFSQIFVMAGMVFASNVFADLALSSMISLSATGQCPFSVTGGPQPTASLRIDAYSDSTPGCSEFSNQFWFLNTSSGHSIILPSGTYSFSDNPAGQQRLCNQVPSAHSFKISQVNGLGQTVSTSTCFVFTCSSDRITCIQTGALTLVNAS